MSNRTIFIGTDLYYSDEFVDDMCTNYNREIRKLKKRIQELENQDILVMGFYGMRGVGKTYYERTKDKIKKHKRTRRNSWNSKGC